MLQRIGVSLEDELLERFDKLIEEKGYTNRSEAIRDLIREKFVEEEWKDSDNASLGLALLVYDHHELDLSQKLAEIQHDHFNLIVSTTHIHIDHHNCLEIIILRGKVKEMRLLGESLVSVKGVKYGKFIPTTTGNKL